MKPWYFLYLVTTWAHLIQLQQDSIVTYTYNRYKYNFKSNSSKVLLDAIYIYDGYQQQPSFYKRFLSKPKYNRFFKKMSFWKNPFYDIWHFIIKAQKVDKYIYIYIYLSIYLSIYLPIYIVYISYNKKVVYLGVTPH